MKSGRESSVPGWTITVRNPELQTVADLGEIPISVSKIQQTALARWHCWQKKSKHSHTRPAASGHFAPTRVGWMLSQPLGGILPFRLAPRISASRHHV